MAAGLTEASGTDTAGSIRVPAAACGLFGFRPTHGLVSTRGVLLLAPSFDAVGVLARRAALLGQAAEVLLASSEAAPGPMRLRTVWRALRGLARVSPGLAAAVQATAQAIAHASGGAVAECPLGSFPDDEVADLFARIQGREVWRAHGSWLSGHRQFLAPDVQSRVDRAEALGRAGPDQADDQAWPGYLLRLGQVLPADSVAVLPVIADLPPLRSAGPGSFSRSGRAPSGSPPRPAWPGGRNLSSRFTTAPAASDSAWAFSGRSPVTWRCSGSPA